MTCFVFHADGGGVKFYDRTIHRLDYEEETESLMFSYADRLFAGEPTVAANVKIAGERFILRGKLVHHAEANDEAIICLHSVEEARHRQMLIMWGVIFVIFLTIVVGLYTIMRLTTHYVLPFTQIAQAAIDMSHGNLNTRVDSEGEKGEVGLLARSFNRLSASLSQSFIQLEQERSRLVQIVNSSTNGIAVTDEYGSLIQYNPALLELFSQLRYNSRRDISEDQKLMVIPDRFVWERFEAVASSGVSERIVYPVDEDRVLWINISPVVSAEGDRVGVVGHFQDMTELERLERTRREYVANVSHELRRPLTALQGLLEPIRDGLVTSEDDKQRYYDIMLHEIERLSRLISDMMQLSRLQSDNIKMQIEPLDISEIVMDVAAGYRADVEGRGTKLFVNAPEGCVAYADGDRVEQVLIVLLDNAMRFTPNDGSISINVYRTEDGTSVCMQVEDTGCGISQKDLPHVFERFYKADKSHASEGTGLGLSIASTIMKKMEGSITCSSELGKGTVMTVKFKAAKEEEIQ